MVTLSNHWSFETSINLIAVSMSFFIVGKFYGFKVVVHFCCCVSIVHLLKREREAKLDFERERKKMFDFPVNDY